MEFGEAITLLIERIVSRLRKPNTICEVVSVDKAKNTCQLKETGSNKTIANARLLSVVDDFEKKFVVYPKVGSLVSIAYLFGGSDKCIVTKYSEVDEILLNGDEFGGLAKTEKIAQRLTRAEEAIEQLRDDFNQHTHTTACTAGGAAVPMPTIPSTVNPKQHKNLSLTQK
jgi:hypothetical protein